MNNLFRKDTSKKQIMRKQLLSASETVRVYSSLYYLAYRSHLFHFQIVYFVD